MTTDDEAATPDARPGTPSGTPPDDVPTVTVVVPVYNDVARLRTCLAALTAQDYPADRFEVVVSDNASTIDLRPAFPDDARFRKVEEPQRGSYSARNTAVRHATGEILAFTDGDCIPRPDWLTRGVAALTAADGPDAVGGEINILFRRGSTPTTGPELYETVEGFDQQRFVTVTHFAATANLLVTSATFRRVGDFNAGLASGGDLEWGRRLQVAGGRLDFAGDAVVDHPSRPSWRDLTHKTLRISHGLVDLTQNPVTADFARDSWHNTKQTFTIWLRIWQQAWPETPGAKLRYAAARSYAGVLELSVRARRGALRRQR
ncbi:glycosyltransferase [Oerskovia flava]|uniref:glycosyltransferase n=1 Tax=Oerskovia flava TaxID=2986422 RepID=UPI002240BDB8|nr:glycosyltransferase family 2 protein [Oerskovia sp. JB1-3-2]